MRQTIFTKTDILLPKERNAEAMRRWSVLACDQYTSDASYWARTAEIVGDAPSTLHMILPELYLEAPDKETRIRDICQTMTTYASDASQVLEVLPQAMLYVERTMQNGKVRRGVIGAIDLEAYDYRKGAVSPIRATEGTVLSRIPPRVQIRQNACLESPHVMILIDDREDWLVSAAAKAKNDGVCCYDFDLMQNGGHLAGWSLTAEEMDDVDAAALRLGDADAFAARYGADAAPLIYAIGDGNHSLATAKACYEQLKQSIGEEAAKQHPARYALAEIVNLHDEALVFEPIYRVLFGVSMETVVQAMQMAIPTLTDCQPAEGKYHRYCVIAQGINTTYFIPNPKEQLPVGTLQAFLDDFLAAHPEVRCDYIHGEASVRALSAAQDTVGILFAGMSKDALFATVVYDGALPRKTFSMGEADEKRFYLECRKIRT